MPMIEKIPPEYRERAIEAFLADHALRHARFLWIAIAVIGVGITVGMLWYYKALDENAWIVAVPIVPGAAVVALKLRDDGKKLPVALAGLGLSPQEKSQLAAELAADPAIQARMSRAGEEKFLQTRPTRGIPD